MSCPFPLPPRINPSLRLLPSKPWIFWESFFWIQAGECPFNFSTTSAEGQSTQKARWMLSISWLKEGNLRLPICSTLIPHNHADFIITSSYQEIAGRSVCAMTILQYESPQSVILKQL